MRDLRLVVRTADAAADVATSRGHESTFASEAHHTGAVAGRRVVLRSPACLARLRLALIACVFQFDTDLDAPRRLVYTCCVAPALEAAKIGSALLAFGKSRPARDERGDAVTTLLSIGPHDNSAPGSTGDVEPRFAKALAAANFARWRGTHLRVYRVRY